MSAAPLLPGVSVLSERADGLLAEVVVNPAEEVFRGHYPGFELLPGMYLLDLVQHLVIGHAHAAGVRTRLAGVRSARFNSVVPPGDTVTVDCAITPGDGQREVRATCGAGNGKVATFRLRFIDLEPETGKSIVDGGRETLVAVG
ncbi:hypothetical protein [Amycolatopsis aidingensis]|uniref:hypothetical protein n=1 Tax=Amycolatopsis aidingensis TaxID=2842453 RepID=UPI001C0AF26A|nr:hypothetical protein [Amycolatopsis aidingensis]